MNPNLLSTILQNNSEVDNNNSDDDDDDDNNDDDNNDDEYDLVDSYLLDLDTVFELLEPGTFVGL